MNRPLPNLVGWSDSLYRALMASTGKEAAATAGVGQDERFRRLPAGALGRRPDDRRRRDRPEPPLGYAREGFRRYPWDGSCACTFPSR